MTEKEKRRFGVARLSELKDQAIVLELETMDVDNDLAIYDAIFRSFALGELDNLFESVVFEGMSEDDRVDLISLVSPYRGLCFYEGKGEYWRDSLEDAPIRDSELITYSIFDNYDYLLELGKKGGKRVLQQLDQFQGSGYISSSVIEYLRRSSVNDEVLETILLDMAREDSLYNIFTDEQKVLLLGNALGNLYTYTKDGVEIKSPIRIAIDLYAEDLGNVAKLGNDNAEDVIAGLKAYLDTADIDGAVVSKAEDYLAESYRNDLCPNKIDSIKVDESFEHLRGLMHQYAASYDEDADVKRK